MLMIYQNFDGSNLVSNRIERGYNKITTPTEITADWEDPICLTTVNLPLKFNVAAPVIMDEKECVFTQRLMGKLGQFK